MRFSIPPTESAKRKARRPYSCKTATGSISGNQFFGKRKNLFVQFVEEKSVQRAKFRPCRFHGEINRHGGNETARRSAIRAGREHVCSACVFLFHRRNPQNGKPGEINRRVGDEIAASAYVTQTFRIIGKLPEILPVAVLQE